MQMVGIELAPMIERILIGFSRLQILPGYHSFSKVFESLYVLEIYGIVILSSPASMSAL